MTENQARKEGLVFSGEYEYDLYDIKANKKIKEEAKKIRKLGYRAISVSGDGGYSVYVEKKYMEDLNKKDKIKQIEYRIYFLKNKIKEMSEELEEKENYLKKIKN